MTVAERTLIVDYDGTITEDDVLDRVVVEFAHDPQRVVLDGSIDEQRLTLHDVLRREYVEVRAARDEVIAWVLENARVRAGFHELVAQARHEGWSLVILSSGFRTLIEPVLEREGLTELTLIANDVMPKPDGWVVSFLDESLCPVCGEACKRRTLAALEPLGEVIYIGDGYSDRCAAGAADRVFARSGLADYLAARRTPFDPFETFHDVVAALRP
jgi:2-hydroxy-3-keto-5-methylthiopentenyl-1-phosphate phosphatase